MRRNKQMGSLREGIVVDAALTCVISAESETRCADDEKREAVGRRRVKGAMLTVDKVSNPRVSCLNSHLP